MRPRLRLTNPPDGYGVVHWLLHWGSAVLVFWLIALGLNMVDLPLGPQKFQDYALHKSLGLTVLVLVLARLAWRRLNGVPALPGGMGRLETLAAKAAHHGIYVLLVVIPLSGWLHAGAAASPANWFGYFTVPDLVGASETAASVFRAVHDIAAKLLMLCLVLHVLGALKHHFVNRDTVLKRMLLPSGD